MFLAVWINSVASNIYNNYIAKLTELSLYSLSSIDQVECVRKQ